MKKLLFILFCALYLQPLFAINKGQPHVWNETYNENNILIDFDHPKSDSIHYVYNDNNILIELGNYHLGKRIGEWYLFDDSLRLMRSGVYDSTEQFTGFKFSHGNMNVQVEYLYDDSTILLNQDTLRQLTNSLWMDLQNLDFWGESVFSSRASEISRLNTKLQIETNNQYKDSLYGLFIYTLSLSKANWSLYHEEKRKILDISFSLTRARFADNVEIFVSRYAIIPLLKEIETILASADFIEMLSSYTEIVEDVNEVYEINSRFRPVNDSIRYYYTTLMSDIESNLAQFEHLDEELQPKYFKFRECDSLDLKIRMGNELIVYMKRTKDTIAQYITYEVQLNNKLSLLNALNTSEIPNFHKNYLTPIETKINGIQQGEIAGQELIVAKGLIDRLDSLIFKVGEIVALEIKLDTNYSALCIDYEKEYESLYRLEIRKLVDFIDEVKETENLNARLQLSNSKIDSLSYFKVAFEQFQYTDSIVTNVFNHYKSLYYRDLRKIYKKEIEKIEKLIAKYDKEKHTNEKLNKIFQIEQRIDFIASSYSKLNSQRLFISENFPVISKNYEDSFPKLYKEVITEYEDSVGDYRSSRYINEKLELGKDVIIGIGYLEMTYDELSLQRQNMCSNYFKTKGLYRKRFKPIFEIEFEEVTMAMENYAKSGEIDSKHNMGDNILSQTSVMISLFPELAYNDSLLKRKLSSNNEIYKKLFKNVYKAHIKGHNNAFFDNYIDIGYVERKQTAGSELLDTVLHYNKYALILKQQDLDIDIAWDVFKKSLSEGERFIWRRGVKVYRRKYKKQFKKDVNIISKAKTGNDILGFVQRMTIFINESSASKKLELKEAKSIEVIMKIVESEL